MDSPIIKHFACAQPDDSHTARKAHKAFLNETFLWTRFYDVPPTSIVKHIWFSFSCKDDAEVFIDCHKSFLEDKIKKMETEKASHVREPFFLLRSFLMTA